MILISRLARVALIATLAGAAGISSAQDSATAAKKALVQKALQLQQAGIEGVGSGLASQTAGQVLQAAGRAMGRVPADKREAVGAELQAEVRKFYDDVAPLLRSTAVKVAPETLGAVLQDKFSEDELKALIAWFESPVSHKYQQFAGEMQQSLTQKVVAETRPQIEPKLKALEQALNAKLNAATAAAASSAPKASAPAAKASAPAKK